MLKQAEQSFLEEYWLGIFQKNTVSESDISSEVILAQIFKWCFFPFHFLKVKIVNSNDLFYPTMEDLRKQLL